MNVRRLALCVVGIVVTGTTIVAQASRLEFAVASVKPNIAGDHRSRIQIEPGGRLNVTAATLKELICAAYRVDDFRVVGGPPWMSSDRWDVQAKADENASQSQINEMFQNLLAGRFDLKFHKDRRKVPVYELVIARNGPKLQQSKSEAAGSSHNSGNRENHGSGGHAGGTSMTTAQLAQMLGQIVGRTVIDKTGLREKYDVRLSWRPDPGQGVSASDHVPSERLELGASSPTDPNLPSIFTALQEQLGLKLQSTKGLAEVMVIDSAQKPGVQR